jgi:altronate hydrolase
MTTRIETEAEATPLTQRAVLLRPDDDVAIARAAMQAGTRLADDAGEIVLRCEVPAGHKLSRRRIAKGDPVRRYGQIIGFATQEIQPGDHVHCHNIGFARVEREYEFCADARPVERYPPERMRHFQGFKRADGRVGTRNYVAIVSTVNCSASVSQFVKQRFADVRNDYPNVDGVIAITHKSGCGMQASGEDHRALERVLAGYSKHPNVAAYVVIGLGCEVNQPVQLVERQRLTLPLRQDGRPPVVSIQESGGVRKAVERAAEEVARLLPIVNDCRRTKQPVSEICLATNCGGSDGNSGITANPALGWAVDELVRYGGTGVLAETPETYGAEHLLVRRAVSREVAQKLLDRYKWWEWYCRGIEGMDDNPAPGNKAGGISTVLEKSLGGVAKGGTTPLVDVYLYGERITSKGFVFMDTPGLDPVSVTGLVAGGCNVVCFTTGRGSVFGCKPAPSLKLATNSAIYRHMEEDMDIDCGVILNGTPVEAVGRQIFERIVAVASGEQTKSELLGVGEEEFAPWVIGPVM